jgi:hypothetical protein
LNGIDRARDRLTRQGDAERKAKRKRRQRRSRCAVEERSGAAATPHDRISPTTHASGPGVPALSMQSMRVVEKRYRQFVNTALFSGPNTDTLQDDERKPAIMTQFWIIMASVVRRLCPVAPSGRATGLCHVGAACYRSRS